MAGVSPVLAPSLSTSALPLEGPAVIRRLSTGSVHSIASAFASSVSSISLSQEPEPVKEEGLRHANVRLQARNYKKPSFLSELLECIQSLNIPTWSNPKILPKDIHVFKVSGSMTNAVFFVSYPTIKEVRTLLLRIYGPSSGNLISRPRELHNLHILSSRYRLGPRVYGTFENGRLEEYFDSKALSAKDMRDPEISRWVGARMAEFHSVDIELIEETYTGPGSESRRWDIAAKKNVKSWLGSARQVLALPAFPQAIGEELDLENFKKDWDRYMQWLATVDDTQRGSKRVFAHNDAQYGNLLRLSELKEGTPAHRQIIVVDFEYAAPNPASFDIANHFHEWTANYDSATPHLLDESLYPTYGERRNFFLAYLEHSNATPCTPSELDTLVQNLEEQVRYWSPASHAMWAIWGIVQARDDVESEVQEPEFDYIGYARCRMAGFRRSLQALGI